MSAPKMYYAVVDEDNKLIRLEVPYVFDDDVSFCLIPIPAHEIDNLIKKYRNGK